MLKVAALAALLATPAAADVMHEPGGWALCDYRPVEWWAAQPSILGGPMQPVAPTHPSVAPPLEWLWILEPGGQGRTPPRPTVATPPAVDGPPVAPVPLGGIAPLFAGLVAGIALARRFLK